MSSASICIHVVAHQLLCRLTAGSTTSSSTLQNEAELGDDDVFTVSHVTLQSFAMMVAGSVEESLELVYLFLSDCEDTHDENIKCFATMSHRKCDGREGVGFLLMARHMSPSCLD